MMKDEQRRLVFRRGLTIAIFILHHSTFIISASGQPISITLRDSSNGLLRTDSANWSEAWIEIDGTVPGARPLALEDLIVRGHDRAAEVLSIDSIGARYETHLALSFVLDNSGSMFHAYDSLTKYCDSILLDAQPGAIAQAVTFDNVARTESHLYTRHSSVFIAQTGFQDSIAPIRAFWHFFDTIRTGYTPLYDAIALATTNIQDRRFTSGDTGRTDVLLVVTDGDDNASRVSIEDLHDLLAEEHLRLFVINYRTDPSTRLLWLARHSNGAFFVAENLASLRTLLHKIGGSLTRQYHVRYRFPSLTPSSGAH